MNCQTQCSTCRKHLRNQEIGCLKCGWVHLNSSGLKSKNDNTATFICQTCSQRPTTADEITPTQKEKPNNANSLYQTSNNLTSPAESQFSDSWANFTDEVLQTLTPLVGYPSSSQWARKKTWYKFVEILSVILDQVVIGGQRPKWPSHQQCCCRTWS